MLHWLVNHFDLGPLNALRWIEFRVVLSFLLACVAVVVLGRPVIALLTRLKVGDLPEFHNQSMNELMKHKANVPTMGGVLIVSATVVSCLLAGNLSREHGFYLWAGLVCLLAHAAIGQVDDWMKLTYGRRCRAHGKASRDGLRTWEKLMFQLGLGMVLSIFLYNHAHFKYVEGNDYHVMSTCLNLPGLKSWAVQMTPDLMTGGMKPTYVPSPGLIGLSMWTFPLLGTLAIAGMSNAVNLTDGLDGLAGGIAIIVCAALAILALIAGYETTQGTVLAKELLMPHVPDSAELAVLAAAMAGACTGFLWFNLNPASVFMGDTGSLALGGTMGFIAVVIRQEILLFVIGGVFILEAISVAIQVVVFKASRGRLGFYDVENTRRVFLMAPIHHHFQKKGWPEQKVVGRFWLVSIILAALALATIKLR